MDYATPPNATPARYCAARAGLERYTRGGNGLIDVESKAYHYKHKNLLSIAACILFFIYIAISGMCGINCFGNLLHMRSLSDTDLGVTILFIVLMLFTFTVSIDPGYNFISSIFVKNESERADPFVNYPGEDDSMYELANDAN